MSAGPNTLQIDEEASVSKVGMAVTVCGLCGHSYAKSAHSGCQSCPLNDGCLMTCCPNCGYSAPDPRNSKLLAAARGARRLVKQRGPR